MYLAILAHRQGDSRFAVLIRTLTFESKQEMLILNDDHVKDILSDSEDERCAEAAFKYEHLSDDRKVWVRYVVENMALQIADERRRYGAVKQRDVNGNYTPMRLMDPLYIALLIDCVNVVQESDSFERAQILGVCAVEHALESVIENPYSGKKIALEIPDTDRVDDITLVAPSKVEWFRNNLGLLTIYSKL